MQGATRLAGLLTAMSQWSLTVKLLAVVKPSDTDGDEWQLLSDVQTQARINLVNGIVEDAAALLGLSSIAAEDRTAKQARMPTRSVALLLQCCFHSVLYANTCKLRSSSNCKAT